MRGSGYNNLYLALGDPCEIHKLARMTDRLDELAPGSAAATATRRLLDALRDDGLRQVWRAVEWLDSHRHGEEQTQTAIHAYERAPGREIGAVP